MTLNLCPLGTEGISLKKEGNRREIPCTVCVSVCGPLFRVLRVCGLSNTPCVSHKIFLLLPPSVFCFTSNARPNAACTHRTLSSGVCLLRVCRAVVHGASTCCPRQTFHACSNYRQMHRPIFLTRQGGAFKTSRRAVYIDKA